MSVISESPDELQGLDALGGRSCIALTAYTQSTPPSPRSSPSADTDQDLVGLETTELLDSPAPFEQSRSRNVTVDIPSAILVTPRSRYDGFSPPAPQARERTALDALMTSGRSSGDYLEFELDQFSFYVSRDRYLDEMRSLHQLSTKVGHGTLYFDGVLRSGKVRHYVQKVEVVELPIGNYGRKFSSVDGQIWVRSRLNRHREVYYLLKAPAAEYARFHTPFIWVANLAKHVADFSSHMVDSNRDVCLYSFKEEFVTWLLQTHGGVRRLPIVKKWLLQHPSHDFRTSVVTNIEFLWKELYGVLGPKKLASFTLFREALSFERFKPDSTPVPLGGMIEAPSLPGQASKPDNKPQYPTIVTPYIKECFGHMVIGKMLRLVGDDTSHPVSDHQPSRNPWMLSKTLLSRDAVRKIKVGDTISTPRDEREKTDTKWQHVASKNSVDDGRWFGLVQKVHINKKEQRSFDVTWLYRPAETPCCAMKYPWPNELFLSDHCTCEEGAASRIKEGEVLAAHSINWFGNPNDSDDRFFIRQMYMVEERRWVTLKKSHLACFHGRESIGFKPGDTILATFRSAAEIASGHPAPPDLFAEPYEVVKVFRQGENLFVRLRKLLRRNKMEPAALNVPCNELVYTDELIVVRKPEMQVLGKCHVRLFQPDEPIHSPYNRGGTGNLFYITRRVDNRGMCVPIGEFPTSLRQGFDPQRQVPKLKGLDLFCGAGNFGRGLEDGGVVEMRWANDIWDKAIHTYMGNSPHREGYPFLGSVDDLLQQAIEGKYSESVPRPGDVDFISAGSPCPGFSLLTQDKTTLKQIKNQSLVASFASFVDFYRPKYGVLENVTGIVPARKNQGENVLSQLFCALVGMGYQTQVILGDAWSHGAPQTRTRVFMYFAAPGLRLPDAPLLSHSHYPGVNRRGVGNLCNGEPFVRRLFEPTAFKYVTAAEATVGLPPVHDSKPDCCVAFPDHRLAFGSTSARQYEIAAIPVKPFGMNFAKAWNEGHGVMSQGDRDLFPAEGSARTKPNAQGYSRQHPNNLFQTVTTSCAPSDARCGSGLHWYESRPLTIMEVRRAQGFQDDEVLLGNVYDKWKLVGNSVARQMALALGLRFREAWLGSLSEGIDEPRLRQPRPPLETLGSMHRSKREAADDTTPASGSPYPSEPDEMESTPATVVSHVTELATLAIPRGTKRRLSGDRDGMDTMTRRLFEGTPPSQKSISRSRSASTVTGTLTPPPASRPGPTVVWIDLT